jgi:hypothetical protein
VQAPHLPPHDDARILANAALQLSFDLPPAALDSLDPRAQHHSYTNEWPATPVSPTIRLVHVD